MRIVFMGTPDFAKNILQGLLESGECEIVAAYTREDAVRGRGKKLVASPVKQFAAKNIIPVETPKNFNDESTVVTLESYKPDFIVVAAYALMLPKPVLDIPKYDCLNVHASLLPRWRGAAPLMRAILNGDDEVGYSIMQITEGMDEGDYTHQASFWVGDNTCDDLFETMAPYAAKSLVDVMNEINNGTVQWTSQNEHASYISYAPKIAKRELWLCTSDEPDYAKRKVLASCEAAPSKCVISNRSVTIERAVLSCTSVDKGTILLKDNKLLLGFGQDKASLEIVKIKPDGKNSMDGKSFAMGIQNGDYTWNELH